MAGVELDATLRSFMLAALALATLACALMGPSYGSPDPTAMAVILVSSFLSSIAGFAFSAICGGVLFHLWSDHVEVVQVMTVCSIANQSAMVCAIQRDIDWRTLPVFLMGGFAGLPFGLWMLLHSDRHAYLSALGILLLLTSSYMLSRRTRPARVGHPALDALAGLLGGITGGAAAFPSAPLTVLCQLRGCDKSTQRALYQPFIVAMQVAAIAFMPMLDNPGRAGSFNPALLFCIPAGLFGTKLGMACYHRISNGQFAMAVNALLALSGLSFLL